MKNRGIGLISAFLVILALTGCSPQLYNQGRNLADKGDYQGAIDLLTQAVRENPQDFRNWQELGVAYYKSGDYAKAEDALKQGKELQEDPRTDLYLGLVYEHKELYGLAIDSYRHALGQNPGGSTKTAINQRLDQLIVKKLNYEVTQALDNENKLSTDSIPENTVGVVDFDAAHMDPNLAPLAKGLAEFTSIDLAKVKSLRVVDRLKIEMILQELQLSSSQYADPNNGPRLGKLLGSSRLVTGTMTGLGDKEMRLDGAVVATSDSAVATTEPSEGELESIFKVQKAFVFKILDKMGVEPTAAERDSIEKAPTDSYLAFLAYCRGLDYRSKGMFREAAVEFNNAAMIDRSFRQASQDASQAQALSSGPQSSGEFESAAAPGVTSGTTGSSLDQFQSSSIANNGFIRDLNNLDSRRGSPEIPPPPTPEINNVTIFIRGTFDAPQR